MGHRARGLEEEEVNWTRSSQNGVIAQLTPGSQSGLRVGGERGACREALTARGRDRGSTRRSNPAVAGIFQACQASKHALSPPHRRRSCPTDRPPTVHGEGGPRDCDSTQRQEARGKSRKAAGQEQEIMMAAPCGFAPCCTPSARPARAQRPCPPSHLLHHHVFCPQTALCPAAAQLPSPPSRAPHRGQASQASGLLLVLHGEGRHAQRPEISKLSCRPAEPWW